MRKKLLLLAFVPVIAAMNPAARAAATVSLSASATAVAVGGSITFTTTVTPATDVSRIVVSYSGESGYDQGTSAPFSYGHQFNSAGRSVTVTATVSYGNGDPDDQATVTVDVVDFTLSGCVTPLRAAAISYIAQVLPIGTPAVQFSWSFTYAGGSGSWLDIDTNGDGKSVWSGRMVVDGTLSCTATILGVVIPKSLTIAINPRAWHVPMTCAQDNEGGWGDVPTMSASLGEERDRDSDLPIVFVPYNGSGNWASAFATAQVPSGPCAGVWYVSSTVLKCQQETVINQYIKSDGPTLGGMNFYDVNNLAGCFTSTSADFVQAVKNHEYRGTPDTSQSIEGHYGRMERSILTDSRDPQVHIEPLTNRDRNLLLSSVNATIAIDEAAVELFAGDESYMETYGPNWGSDSGSLGQGQNSRWDPINVIWTDCVNAPYQF